MMKTLLIAFTWYLHRWCVEAKKKLYLWEFSYRKILKYRGLNIDYFLLLFGIIKIHDSESFGLEASHMNTIELDFFNVSTKLHELFVICSLSLDFFFNRIQCEKMKKLYENKRENEEVFNCETLFFRLYKWKFFLF